MSTLRHLVFNNWHLKLLSLALAFILWSTYTAEPQVEIGYLVPVEFIGLSDTLEITGDVPTQVHIRLRGRSTILRRLTPADLAISLDMQSLAAGEHSVLLSPTQLDLPPGAEAVRFAPSQIRVRLIPRNSPPS